MDKKNLILGTLFFVLGMGLMMWNGKQVAEANRQAALNAPVPASVNEVEATESGIMPEPVAAFEAPDGFAKPITEVPVETSVKPEGLAVLENDYLKATLTTKGASLRTVELKEFPATQNGDEPVVLHALAKVHPLSLHREVSGQFYPLGLDYKVVEQTATLVVFELGIEGGIRIRRSYALVEGDPEGPAPYTIEHKTTLINPTEVAFSFDRIFINIGTAAPTNTDPYGMDLNASYYDDGDYDNIASSKFKGGGFFFKSEPKERVEKEGLMQWASVKNQFFTSILTPAEAGSIMVAKGVKYPRPQEMKADPVGVTAYLGFDIPAIAPGSEYVLAADYYSGPKAFKRLEAMSLEQEDVMQLGWFLWMFIGLISFVAKSLLSLLTFLHGFVGNWGFAIILMTLVVRLCLWPLTAKAARASKRMQELAKPMAEIKEKYKDNPQKQQMATMELFKKHRINPLSGCWPVLLQFPIFIAMFNLLRNTADLRFAHFLWIDDLSMPDATIHLGEASLPFIGNTINVLPFVWLVSMWFQMKAMPQPSVDNSQMKIVKYMPFIFFPMTYVFGSGLVLYWTTTNCFSIFQGWMTRRNRDAEDILIEAEVAAMDEKKSSKINVTPIGKKKKKK